MTDFTLTYSFMRHLCYKLGNNPQESFAACAEYDASPMPEIVLIKMYINCEDNTKREYVIRHLKNDINKKRIHPRSDLLLDWCQNAEKLQLEEENGNG